MRVLNTVFAVALCGGVMFATGAANAQRLDTAFDLEDTNDPNGNTAFLVISGTTAFVEGGVVGTGTAGDDVEITYFTNTPTNVSADDKQARVRQTNFSTISFFIDSETPARDLELTLNPEKCKIDAKVQAVKTKGDVTVSCSGTNIYAGISADQEASIQAAFLDNKQVKVKVTSDGSKGSITIKLKGVAIDED